jgi:inorganic phosphate transporter, PiT family
LENPVFLVIGAIGLALVFDIINGFHDAANSIATVVSTRVLSPRYAVLWAAFFNFIAMFIFQTKVADTISKIIYIDPGDPAFIYVVLSGLIGAIVWDLLTWWWKLPTSSSHALVGGLAGAGLTYAGTSIINWGKLLSMLAFIPLAPLIGMFLGFGVMLTVFWIFRKWRPQSVDRFFRKGQLVSAALYSLGHGGNDAQKTMGIIVALLVAGGMMTPDTHVSLTTSGNILDFFRLRIDWDTAWIILACHAAMALGTALGGWRIVKTMGMKLTKLKPVGGFCAETAGAATLFIATQAGIPVSTTHTIAGSIIGVGCTMNASHVKWGIASRIIVSWIVTVPFSAAVAAGCFLIFKALHAGF